MVRKKENTAKEKDWFFRIIVGFNVLFLAVFLYLFSEQRNYEFLIYLIAVILVVFAVAYLHKKFVFSKRLLAGFTLLNIFHHFGGRLVLGGERLYGHYIIPEVLRFDKIVHFFGIFIITLAAYEILKHHLGRIKDDWVIMMLLVFVGMGVGTIWEFVEFFPVVFGIDNGVGGYMNTVGDLIANTIGAMVAVVYVERNVLRFRKK